MRASLLLPFVYVVLAHEPDNRAVGGPLEGILSGAIWGLPWDNEGPPPWAAWGLSEEGSDDNDDDEGSEEVQVIYNVPIPESLLEPDGSEPFDGADMPQGYPQPPYPPQGPGPYVNGPPPPSYPAGPPPPGYPVGPPPPGPMPHGPPAGHPRPYLGPVGYGKGTPVFGPKGPMGPPRGPKGPFGPYGPKGPKGFGPKGAVPWGPKGPPPFPKDPTLGPYGNGPLPKPPGTGGIKPAPPPANYGVGPGNSLAVPPQPQGIPPPAGPLPAGPSPPSPPVDQATALPASGPNAVDTPNLAPSATPLSGLPAAPTPLAAGPAGAPGPAPAPNAPLSPPSPNAPPAAAGPPPPGPDAATPPAANLPPVAAAGAGSFKLTPGRPGPLQLAIATPTESASNDFIGSLTGKGIGWGALSVGGGMLGNILVGVSLAGPSPSGKLLFAKRYGMPQPFNQPNITLSTIASETYSKGSDWKYTFLCKNCFSLNPGLKAATPAPFGWAFAAKDKYPTHKHEQNGRDMFDLRAAKTDGFAEMAKSAAM